MQIIIDHSKIQSFLGIVIYRFLLDFIYIFIVNPYYSYSGFTCNPNALNGTLSWIILIIAYLMFRGILYDQRENISAMIISVLFLISFVPFTTCVFVGLTSTSFILSNCIYWIILIAASRYILMLGNKRLPRITVGSNIISDKFIIAVGIISLIVVLMVSGVYAHFRLNFDLFNVYDLRMESREYNMPTVIKYMFAWTKAINTLMLAYCLIKRKRIMAVLFFAIQMLSFGVDGSKATFFLPFLVLIVVGVGNKITVNQIKLFLVYGLLILTAVTLLEYVIFHTYYIATLIVRRVLFLPNLLHTQYFEYFSSHVPDYFRGSFLRIFGLQSPYAQDGGFTYTIGRVYYGRSTMNCNNGLISDAIANLGFIGIVVMPILLVFFLRLFDRSTFGLDKRLTLVSGLYIAIMLMSTSLTTVLFTHGLLILIIITWLMNPDESVYEEDVHNEYLQQKSNFY